MWTLDMILDLLSHYHQRATFGALGGVLHVPARSLMMGRPRNPHHSWVVSQSTLQPTGYAPDECDPYLYERDAVLTTAADLLAWLNNPN